MGLKEEFLKLLKEDEEFRLAVAGLLGLEEVLRELRRLREDFNKLERRIEELREDFNHFVQLEEERWRRNEEMWLENQKRWEENWRRWEESQKRWEENERRWLENEKRWEENWRRWEENDRKWKEWFEIWKRFLDDYFAFRDEVNKRFSRLEEGLGALTESTYTHYVWEDLNAELTTSGEVVLRRVRNADFDGVDVDLFVETDKRVYVVEVKVRPRVEDVGALLAKAEVVGDKVGKPAVPVLAGALMGKDVLSYAKGKGILVYVY